MNENFLRRCLALNAAALAFSLAHVMGDFALVFRLLPEAYAIHGAFVALAASAYGWWGWSLARVAGDGRSGLVSLLLPSVVMAGGNGATIVFCPPPCGGASPYQLWPDVSHVGSLLFGFLSARATWMLLRATRPDKGGILL